MEIIIPNPNFDFNSTRSTPYTTAPSTPKRFGECYFSAPPSPGHASQFYCDYNDSDIPIGWEEKEEKAFFDDDFAFDISGDFEKMILPAEELFDGGKIRSLQPPTKIEGQERGRDRDRERKMSSLPSSSSRRTRSVSPYRVSKYPWEEEGDQEIQSNKSKKKQTLLSSKPELNSTSSSLSTKSGSRKWRLKDFFLFRSASEGRAFAKDPLRKYTALFKKNDEKKISSSRKIEGGSVSNRRGQVSAHELHYTKNRAVSEDLKKKTFLPYKHGILGRWFV